MTDTNRPQELAAELRKAFRNISVRLVRRQDLTEVLDALDELSRIKGVNFNAEVEKIAKWLPDFEQHTLRFAADPRATARMLERIKVVLDALRAKEAECAAKHENKESREYFEKAADIFKAERDDARTQLAAVQANFEALSKRATEERDRLKGELAEISAAWEAEYSMGGTEPEPPLTCMLLALKHLRDQKRDMENGFNALISQRDEARADADECRRDRDTAIKSLEARTAEFLRVEERLAACEPVIDVVRALQDANALMDGPEWAKAFHPALLETVRVSLPPKKGPTP